MKELKYEIEFYEKEIPEKEIIPLINRTIQGLKEDNPDKAHAFDDINVTDTGRRHIRLAVDQPIGMLILVYLGSKIAYDVWHEIILPKLKERLKIETA
ncbi:MAG: hypothetical protein QMC77_07615 [Methanocellales archaeon]|nr:hypothetical protein [Methanocellales archaeon]